METLTLFPEPAAVSTKPALVKTITWATNFNNKMGNNGFVHIDLVPFIKPVRSKVEQYIIEIYTADVSHPPIQVKMMDMMILPVKSLSCLVTLASHGMDEMEFFDYLHEKHGNKVSMDMQLAVYYYKRLQIVG